MKRLPVEVTQLIGKRIKFLFKDLKGTRLDCYTQFGVVLEADVRNEFIKVLWDDGKQFSVNANSPGIMNWEQIIREIENSPTKKKERSRLWDIRLKS